MKETQFFKLTKCYSVNLTILIDGSHDKIQDWQWGKVSDSLLDMTNTIVTNT